MTNNISKNQTLSTKTAHPKGTPPTKHSIITTDGSVITYYKSGRGSTHLLLIHGNYGKAAYFDTITDLLAQHFSIIAMNTRDHADSTNTQQELTFDLVCQDISELLAHEGITKTAIFGFSDGANIGLFYTILHPEQVEALILGSPNLTFNSLKKFFQVESRVLYHVAHFLSSLLPIFKRPSRIFSLLTAELPISNQQLEQMTTPCLLLYGETDVVKPRHINKLYDQLQQAERFTFHSVGHRYIKKHPEEVASLITHFLQLHISKGGA
ncbi:alpha/beta fold hydrolase [Bavariicoccus seileri]|uniref:alpha/beta fold hydrolase n=1 Tax=Bavariicoccus seileri TaxID=549685 RepID=UPI0003B5CF33|nr:alpha/beta hydrolase [Bavariicoccus seileri]